jgi:hypothetical protein
MHCTSVYIPNKPEFSLWWKPECDYSNNPYVGGGTFSMSRTKTSNENLGVL